MTQSGFFGAVTAVFEVEGVTAMALGFIGAIVLAIRSLVRTVTSTPSLTDALVLAIVVLIRTVLSFSLQVEIEGIAPWRRALLTSPELMVRTAARGAQTHPDSSRKEQQ